MIPSYFDLSDMVRELNDVEREAQHYADRAWGWANTANEDWEPVAAQATALARDASQVRAIAVREALNQAIVVFNEHSELTVRLTWDKYDGRWELM
jgi:hypothetical protein